MAYIITSHQLDEAAGYYGALHRRENTVKIWRLGRLPIFLTLSRQCAQCHRPLKCCRYARFARAWKTAGISREVA